MAASSTVLVLFPDDFAEPSVMTALLELATHCPALLVVLVTASPARYTGKESSRAGRPPLIVPKPVWGSALIDVDRERLEELEAAAALERGKRP
jgi:hypothetical protein